MRRQGYLLSKFTDLYKEYRVFLFQNTLFESENERQKIEPVPIPIPRASRNFPDVKTRNE
jgi:hypothetical protein